MVLANSATGIGKSFCSTLYPQGLAMFICFGHKFLSHSSTDSSISDLLVTAFSELNYATFAAGDDTRVIHIVSRHNEISDHPIMSGH